MEMKRCTKCSVEYPATDEYFNKNKNNKDGLGFWCKKCANEIKQEKRKQTCLEKYGVESPMQSEEIKEKIKQTCLEKYGVENPYKLDKFKEKCKKKHV